MPNADNLWQFVLGGWPANRQTLTIADVENIAPLGTAGINNRSSYDFAMLTMLSTNRRNYIRHLNLAALEAINAEIILANRNNGIWRHYLEAEIEMA
jgi:hypothetical protein